MTTKSLQQFIEEAKKADSYWIETAKLEFTFALERQRRQANISYKQIADRLGKSPAYISKVFRGDENLTIESMVKLCRAVEGKFHPEVFKEGSSARWFNAVKGQRNCFIDSTAKAEKILDLKTLKLYEPICANFA